MLECVCEEKLRRAALKFRRLFRDTTSVMKLSDFAAECGSNDWGWQMHPGLKQTIEGTFSAIGEFRDPRNIAEGSTPPATRRDHGS